MWNDNRLDGGVEGVARAAAGLVEGRHEVSAGTSARNGQPNRRTSEPLSVNRLSGWSNQPFSPCKTCGNKNQVARDCRVAPVCPRSTAGWTHARVGWTHARVGWTHAR
eukprot:185818-Pyramimonas_sp.AAC.1